MERVKDKITDYVVDAMLSRKNNDCLLCYVTNVMGSRCSDWQGMPLGVNREEKKGGRRYLE